MTNLINFHMECGKKKIYYFGSVNYYVTVIQQH